MTMSHDTSTGHLLGCLSSSKIKNKNPGLNYHPRA